jgi:hypothetical protein
MIGALMLMFLALPFYHVANAAIVVLFGQPVLGTGVRASKDVLFFCGFTAMLAHVALQGRFRRLSAADWAVLLFGLLTVMRAMLGSSAGLIGTALGGRQNLTIVIVYFLGRGLPPQLKTLRWFLAAFAGVGAFSALVAAGEMMGLYSVPEMVGLIEYMERTFDQQSTGEYGLTWTFHTAFGLRRYSGITGNPLEAAMLSLLSIAIVVGLSASRTVSRGWTCMMLFVLMFGLASTVSRASTAGAILVMGTALFVPGVGVARLLSLAGVAGAVILVVTTPVLSNFVRATVSLANPSALGHYLEWMDGVRAVADNPLGLGLGTSGTLGTRLGVGIGGESQYIITAVQMGVIGLVSYLSAWAWTFAVGLRTFMARRGSLLGGAALALVLARIGLAVPAASSAFETYLSISLPVWWLSGVISYYLETSVRPCSA